MEHGFTGAVVSGMGCWGCDFHEAWRQLAYKLVSAAQRLFVVYLHAGGFTSGDKNADTKMLQWLCEKGYVAADRRGIRWR